jgi:zinc finger BED domain-containing protein 1 (E3 SUMO-protein ligase ZBED1)
MDEAVVEDLFLDMNGDDDEGFTAAERFPLSLLSLLNDPSEPMDTINKTRYQTIKGYTETRWHSILIMLESLGSQRVAVNRILCMVKKPMSITSEDWELIQELIRFLRLFREAVEMFSYENKPTLCNALLFRIEIENSLQSVSKDNYLIAQLKEKMRERLDYRFPITNEMLVSTFLDPRLQNLPRLLSELNKKNISKFDFLKNECLKIIESNPIQFQVDVNSPRPSEASNVKRLSTVGKLIEKHAYHTPNLDSITQDSQLIDQEIHKYFLTVIPKDGIDNFDILRFWRDHSKSLPTLAELCKKYLCIPVTSTSSERAFSYAGLLLNAKRSSLSPNVVERTLFIHDNYTLVKETILSKED